MARNRYGWTKRTKELARKAKQEEKMKRRQNKSVEKTAEEIPANQDAEERLSNSGTKSS